MKPGDAVDFKEIKIEAVHSYNIDKNFHQKSHDNLGFVVTIGGTRIYHAGDTDFIPEMKNIQADVVLLPIGTYTMDVMGAVDAVSAINPKIAIPMHYGTIVGSKEDAVRFSNLCTCKVVILAPEQ
jgi:L-ascorbate metabolism protein UlaG (beta-lactamase superfamily)